MKGVTEMKKLSSAAAAILLLAAFLFTGCAAPNAELPAQTDPPASASATETVSVATEPASELPDESSPTVIYDESSSTYFVTGKGDYESLVFPEAEDASRLSMENGQLSIVASLNVLKSNGVLSPDDLPGFVSRCDKSLAFICGYLEENAAGAYPADQAAFPVELRFTNGVKESVKNYKGVISIYSTSLIHRDFYYLLALMGSANTGWEQFGFAWYFSSCLDPYSEFQHTAVLNLDSDSYYTPICVRAGIDSAVLTPSQFRTFYDSVARYCFENGLMHWGSVCESAPVTHESIYKRGESEASDSLDDKLSAFMAASFIARLDELYGFESVSSFVFGQKDFDDAFGSEADSEFESWKDWLIERYPMP